MEVWTMIFQTSFGWFCRFHSRPCSNFTCLLVRLALLRWTFLRWRIVFPLLKRQKTLVACFGLRAPLCHFFLAWVGASGKTHIAVDQYQYGKGKAACFNKELFIATCWWFRNPAAAWYGTYPIIYKVLYIQVVRRISSINSMLLDFYCIAMLVYRQLLRCGSSSFLWLPTLIQF